MPNWLGAIDIGPLRDHAYLQPDARLADGRVHDRVERLGAVHLEDGAHLEVILQILADTGLSWTTRDPVLGEERRRPDARKLEEAR